jgi:hypothetical protein
MRSAALVLAACGAHPAAPASHAPVIDRFSARAGHLLVRAQRPTLPKPDEPIDFDQPPFVTQGLGPDGVPVRYYNFDVQPDTPATLYRFDVPGQPDVVDRIPGEPGYSDFWRVVHVAAPPQFVPGSITSAGQLHAFALTPTQTVLDCPIVPRHSTARGGHGVPPPVAHELAYRGARVTCLLFSPGLQLDGDRVPTSPIYVTFAPSAAFQTEGNTPQTHNVVMSLPGDVDYSPLWAVHVYDRAQFGEVHDATTALAARVVDRGPNVNCPIVAIRP